MVLNAGWGKDGCWFMTSGHVFYQEPDSSLVPNFYLSRGRMIWFLTQPLSRQQAGPATHRKTEKERELADGRGEEGGEEPNHTTTRKPGPL
jgi:hypothetical protein